MELCENVDWDEEPERHELHRPENRRHGGLRHEFKGERSIEGVTLRSLNRMHHAIGRNP